VEVAVGTELGIWQRRQSDAHLAECIAPNVTLFALADGFGEIGRGVPVATLALGTLRDYLRRRYRAGSFGRSASPSGLRAILLAALDHANARLYAQSGSHEDFVSSGTSLTAVLLVGHQALVGHVGDARAYLLRLGRLDMLTSDDAMFADAAVTSAKTALPAKPRTRGLLWRSLGTQAKLEASIAHVELLAGDQIALCTDGVHRCIDDDELADALTESETAADAVARVLAGAKARGNVDNGTLIVGRELLVATPPALLPARRRGTLRALLCLALMIATLAMFGAYWVRGGVTDHSTNYSTNDR
jgi:serine/threonine protein phosphatase PrpC